MKSVFLKKVCLVYKSDVVRAGADLVWSVCKVRKIRLEYMVRVSFDTLK